MDKDYIKLMTEIGKNYDIKIIENAKKGGIFYRDENDDLIDITDEVAIEIDKIVQPSDDSRILCFKINNRNLYLEKTLYYFNEIPILFICKDDESQYYLVLCYNYNNFNYIVAETTFEILYNMLSQQCDLRTPFLLANKGYRIIIAADTNDIDKDDVTIVDLSSDIYSGIFPKAGAKYVEQEHKTNQLRIDKMIKVTDDWSPCFENNTVKVSMFLTYVPEHNWCFVRILAWGADDFGLEMDYTDFNYDNLIAKYNKWKSDIYDNAVDGINKKWFRDRGFYNA